MANAMVSRSECGLFASGRKSGRQALKVFDGITIVARSHLPPSLFRWLNPTGSVSGPRAVRNHARKDMMLTGIKAIRFRSIQVLDSI